MTHLWLGNSMPVGPRAAASEPTRYELPAHHLVTHGVIVGMTGSGKTGLVTVMVEEAAQRGVPVIVIDVKGDLPNLLLTPSGSDASVYLPWVQGEQLAMDLRPPLEFAQATMLERRKRLADWGIDDAAIEKHRAAPRSQCACSHRARPQASRFISCRGSSAAPRAGRTIPRPHAPRSAPRSR